MGVVALYPLSSPNHNFIMNLENILTLRYILFHHQTTTFLKPWIKFNTLRYILFHHQTTTRAGGYTRQHWLRYILFHHQTTTQCDSSFPC